MAKLTLTDAANLNNQISFLALLAANNAATEAALENTLSRDGTDPNQMESDLDMNSNQIINLPAATTSTEPVRKNEYDAGLAATAAEVLAAQLAATNAASAAAAALAAANAAVNLIFISGTIASLNIVLDGGGIALSTGVKVHLEVPFACRIKRATLLADQTGSIVVDIYKSEYSTYNPPTHPAVSDKITGSTPPTISAGIKAQNSSLTGWTTSIAEGDILAIDITSVSTIGRVTLALKLEKV